MIIESLGVYLPPKVVSTDDVLRGCKNKVTFPLERMTGIQSRRMAGEDEFATDLARKAVAECLAHSKHQASDVDLLICCNISRYDGPNHRISFEPSTSVKLRKDFGLDNALVFDVSNACAGVFTGLCVAEAFLKAGAARCPLVVSGEYISHLTLTAQKEIDGFMDPRMACLTLGDSGVAMILSESPSAAVGFQTIDMYTLGRYSTFCIAKATDQEHGGAIMVTDAVKSSAIAIQQAVMHSRDVLKRNGWAPDSFQHLIMHQTSETALNGATREINQSYQKKIFHEGNVVSNLAERGNTATTTHFVAVMDHIKSGRIRSGDRVAFGISGSGQTTGTALYVFDDLPDRIRSGNCRLPIADCRLKNGDSSNGQSALKIGDSGNRQSAIGNRQSPRVRIESVGTIPEGQEGGRDTVDLVKRAAQDCLARSSHDRKDIDLLLYAGVYRNDFICEPAIATMAAGQLEINDIVQSPADKKTLAFDVFNGGVGFLNACHLGIQMIRAKKSKRVLVVASEIENNADVLPEKLLGLEQTGSALILDESADGQTGFGGFVFRVAEQHQADIESHVGQVNGKTCLSFQKSADLEKHYLEMIPGAVRELLENEGLTMAQVKAVFPPQMSASFIADLSARLGVPHERCVDVTRPGKDYFTSSLAYALRHAQDSKQVGKGDIALIINVGAGIQVGCAIYYF